MAREKNAKGPFVCPVGRFFQDLEKVSGKKSKFFEHLSRSHVEFLKAFKSLLDERIADIEKKAAGKGKRKMTKVPVD